MTSTHDSIRESLLQQDPMAASERSKYDAELHKLFDQKLGKWSRLRYLIPAIGGLCMTLALTALALSEPPSTPFVTRVALLIMAAIGAFWFAVCARILRRGSTHYLRDQHLMVNAALFFSIMQLLFFGWRASLSSGFMPALVTSLAFVVLAGIVLLVQRLRESELRLREQVLRAQLNTAPEH